MLKPLRPEKLIKSESKLSATDQQGIRLGYIEYLGHDTDGKSYFKILSNKGYKGDIAQKAHDSAGLRFHCTSICWNS